MLWEIPDTTDPRAARGPGDGLWGRRAGRGGGGRWSGAGRARGARAGAARAAAPGRDLRLVVDAVEGALPVVQGDAVRLRQVVDNLLSNAVRYSPDGQPVLVRVGMRGGSTNPTAVLEVVDAGPGLSSEQAVRVFERFYRADPARSPAEGGNGLGLAIVAAISAAHGGVVEVDTAPGQGATFRVLLPVAGPVPPGPHALVVGNGAGAGAVRDAAAPTGQGAPVA